MPADSKKFVEPVTVASFVKNKRGEIIRVGLADYETFKNVEVRQCFTQEDGTVRGTGKGCSLNINLIDELIAGLGNARAQAVEKGWLSSEKKAA